MKTHKILLTCWTIIFILAMTGYKIFSQTIFESEYGGNYHDIGYSVVQTADGGYILAGNSQSFGTGGIYVIKTDVYGDTVWTKIYGPNVSASSWARLKIISSMEGGYLIAATAWNPTIDAYLLKIDSGGNIQWSNKYGQLNTNVDEAFSVIQKSNGNYLFAGSFAFAGIIGTYIGEVSQNGNYLGATMIGDTTDEQSFWIAPASNGYVVVGYNSSWIPVSGYVKGACLRKFDNNNVLQWNVCIDSVAGDGSFATGAVEASDGGFVMTGRIGLLTSSDIFLLKTNSLGTVQWIKIYQGEGLAHSVIRTNDNGYLIFGEQVVGGGWKAIKTDSAGNVQWAKNYLGTGAVGYDVKQTSDGGFIFVGSINTGVYNDFYLIKTDSMGNTCSSVTNFTPTVVDTMLFTDARGYAVNIFTSSEPDTITVTNVDCYYVPVCLVTGFSEPELENNLVKIFPNPFSTEITLKINQNSKNATLTIFNSFGQQVKQIKNINGQTVTLHRDNLPSGLYFIRITQDSKVIATEKLVIMD